MAEKHRIRRRLRKWTTEVALGLVEPGDHIEAMNAGQKQLLRMADEDPDYAWLKRRLLGKEIRYYREW